MHIGQTVYCLARKAGDDGDWVTVEGEVISFDEETVCVKLADTSVIFSLLGGGQELGFTARNTVFEEAEYAIAIVQQRNNARTAKQEADRKEAEAAREVAVAKVKGA